MKVRDAITEIEDLRMWLVDYGHGESDPEWIAALDVALEALGRSTSAEYTSAEPPAVHRDVLGWYFVGWQGNPPTLLGRTRYRDQRDAEEALAKITGAAWVQVAS